MEKKTSEKVQPSSSPRLLRYKKLTGLRVRYAGLKVFPGSGELLYAGEIFRTTGEVLVFEDFLGNKVRMFGIENKTVRLWALSKQLKKLKSAV